MRKSLIYLMSCLGFCLTACDSDFFKTESPSAMDVSTFTIPSETEKVVAGIYEVFGEQNSYRTRLGGPWVNPGNDCEIYAEKAPNFAIYTMTSVGHADITAVGKHPWAYLTTAIERANVCIDGIETYSDTTITEFRYLYGEALTLRAWLNYEMVKLWGDIPYMFAPIDVTDEAAIYPSKVDRNLVFEQMRKDLRHAAELMPNSVECPGVAKNTVERCNREFALGLLARVDLVYAGKALRPDNIARGSSYKVQFNTTPEKRVELLNEVMWACEEVMKADGDSKLLADYEEVFRNITVGNVAYNKTETLFEIPFANNVRGQFLNRMGAYVNKTALGHLVNTTGSSKSNAKIAVTPKLLFSFDKNDKRKWVTASYAEWMYDADKTADIDPTASGAILYQKPLKIHKFYVNKYRYDWLGYETAKDDDGVNIPIMRYSDILLMYAEAAIGSVCEVTPTYVGSFNAQECFNKVRRRAGVEDKTLTMEAIMQERAWEFTGEFVRKYDLMRWGVFAEKLVAAQQDYEYFTKVKDEKIDFTGTPYEGQLGTDVYYKYKAVNGLNKDGGKAYVIDQVYGLALGENEKPEGYVDSGETGGWIKSDIFTSDKQPAVKTGENGSRVYGVGMEKSDLENRQYWPLFDVITSANPNLWNDYGY